MASVDDVKKLASLVRLSLTEDELKKFAAEFDAIVAYVGQIEKLDISIDKENSRPPHRNVFREDGEPHEKGKYTQKILEQFPAKEGNYLSVKKIISYD